MEALMIFITELERLPVDIDGLHFVRGSKTDIRRFAGCYVTDDRLHKRSQVARGAVLDFKDYGRVPVVTDCHAFSEIVC